MKTITIHNHQLHLTTRPLPEPKADEVLIRVAAAGVNRADIYQRQGSYPAPEGVVADVPGLEVAGTSVDSGEPVCALLAGGGYAEYVVAPRGQVLPIPAGLTMEQAASLPEAVFTVWMTLFEKGGLQPGSRVLIHGGASGIGVIAIQMAKAAGAAVYTTAGTPEKCRKCEALGATLAICYREQDFVELAKEMDVILDMVGGSYFQRNLKCLKPVGKLISIAFQESARAEVNFSSVLMKNLTMIGVTLRSRTPAEKARFAQAIRHHVWPWVEQGKVVPVIDSMFSLADAAHAHARLEGGGHMGKVVLGVR